MSSERMSDEYDIIITPTFYLDLPGGMVELDPECVSVGEKPRQGVILRKLEAHELRASGRPPKPKSVWENEAPTPSDKQPTLVVVGGKETDG
jgi:hypothetical protein